MAFDALEVLAIALDFERRGEQFYREAEVLTADPTGQRMFAKLAADERAHARWIEQARESLQHTGAFPQISTKEASRRLGGLRQPTFPQPEVYTAARPKAHELDALRRGIQTEEESRAFYARAAERTTDPDGKTMFARLAEVEEGHRVLLQGEFDYLTRTGMYFGLPDFSLEAMVE